MSNAKIGDVKMLIYAGSAFLIGILLGLKYRVLILLPATFIVLAGGVVLGVFQQNSTAGALLLTVVSLQVGYLVGGFAMLTLQRVGHRNSGLHGSTDHKRAAGFLRRGTPRLN